MASRLSIGSADITAGAPAVFDAASEGEFEPIAARLLAFIERCASRPTIVTLSGELGAGKTVLARYLIHLLGHRGRVKSPTYTLVETYQAGDRQVAHLDLYRLNSSDELEDIGFRDLLADVDIVLVEWPERASGSLPPADWVVVIEYAGSGRRVTVSAGSA